jgi:protein-L-isoaspartate(D-aspartate) O-methyltransferase
MLPYTHPGGPEAGPMIGKGRKKGNGVPGGGQTDTDPYLGDRLRMVEDQIRRRDVRDRRVLQAMETVPRHLFVLGQDIDFAYSDTPLPIGHGQTISQPYIVALMTEMLELGPTHRVLEIGTGSGYQAAVLSLVAGEVFTVEFLPFLGADAKKRLESLGYKNIRVRIGDGFAGWPEEAPFDAVIVTAAPETVPKALVDQLKDGGRMAIPVGTHFQELFLIRKAGGKTTQEKVADVRFVPMVGKEKR